jgi:subtilisin family serine protease
MATPHVAGLAAYLLSLGGKISPAALRTKIQSLATTNTLKFPAAVTSSRTPNSVVFSGWTS